MKETPCCCLLDPPGTPNCIDVTRDSVTLQWDIPNRDGGSKIVAYSVERRQGRAKWLRCNFTDISETQFTVTGLSAGDRFEFRVIARNAVGTVSPPSNSSGYIMTTDQSSTYIVNVHMDTHIHIYSMYVSIEHFYDFDCHQPLIRGITTDDSFYDLYANST